MDERDDRSLGRLFGDLSRQLSTLIQQEITLARTEMVAKATDMARDGALVGVGAALGYGALLIALVAVSLLIAQLGVTAWLAFLIVAVVAGVLAVVLIQRGRQGLARADLTPRQTIRTVKEDATWIKERAK